MGPIQEKSSGGQVSHLSWDFYNSEKDKGECKSDSPLLFFPLTMFSTPCSHISFMLKAYESEQNKGSSLCIKAKRIIKCSVYAYIQWNYTHIFIRLNLLSGFLLPFPCCNLQGTNRFSSTFPKQMEENLDIGNRG